MSVSLLLITHGNIGKELLSTAETLYGQCPLKIATINFQIIDPSEKLEHIQQSLQKMIIDLDQGQGILIFIDLFGATPYNLILKSLNTYHYRIITGVNLPMLLSAFNHSKLALPLLAEKVIAAGQESMMISLPYIPCG